MNTSDIATLVFRANKSYLGSMCLGICVALVVSTVDAIPALSFTAKRLDMLLWIKGFLGFSIILGGLPAFFYFTTYEFNREQFLMKSFGTRIHNILLKDVTNIDNSIAPGAEYSLYGDKFSTGISVPKYTQKYQELSRELMLRIQVANPNVQINEKFRKKFNIP